MRRYKATDPLLSAWTILVAISLIGGALIERLVFGGHPPYVRLVAVIVACLIFDAFHNVRERVRKVEDKLDSVIAKLNEK
jgi:hypothetical protein